MVASFAITVLWTTPGIHEVDKMVEKFVCGLEGIARRMTIHICVSVASIVLSRSSEQLVAGWKLVQGVTAA